MTNTSDAEQVALSIISSNRYLTLAVCDNNMPWAAPIAFIWHPDNSFIFYSAREARHSRAGIESGIAAGAIFNSTAPSDTADGVQFSASLAEVDMIELDTVMAHYYELIFDDEATREQWRRPAADFQGDSPQRFYRIVMQEAFVLDPESPTIDRRRRLNLGRLFALRS